MIEGLKVDLTTEELIRLFDTRIAHHSEVADDCERRRSRLEALTHPGPEDTDGQLMLAWPHFLEYLDRRAVRHRDRARTLRFLRDHLKADEIYRLGEDDLQILQLWPGSTTVKACDEEDE